LNILWNKERCLQSNFHLPMTQSICSQFYHVRNARQGAGVNLQRQHQSIVPTVESAYSLAPRPIHSPASRHRSTPRKAAAPWVATGGKAMEQRADEDLHPGLKQDLGRERGRTGPEVASGRASLAEARDGHGGGRRRR
jgi:hypothetical protein